MIKNENDEIVLITIVCYIHCNKTLLDYENFRGSHGTPHLMYVVSMFEGKFLMRKQDSMTKHTWAESRSDSQPC